MPNKQIDNYLEDLGANLRALPPARREEELREVEQHLEALVSAYLQDGYSREEATHRALLQFDQAKQLGRALYGTWFRQQLLASARLIVRPFSVWLGIATVNFLFFSSMNDKPTDFPYTIEATVLLSAMLAVPSLWWHFFLAKRKSLRG